MFGRIAAGLGLALVVGATPSMAHAQNRNLRAVAIQGPSQVLAGQSASFDLTIESTGTLASGSYSYRIVLTAGGILNGAVTLGTYTGASIQPGSTSVIQRSVTIPSNVAGIFQPALVIDPSNTLIERNEWDNAAIPSATLRVLALAPDLRPISLTPPSFASRVGDTLAIGFSIANRGAVGATTEAAVYLSVDEQVSTDDVFLGSSSLSIGANSSASGSIDAVVPSDIFAGDYTLGLIVDADGVSGDAAPLDNVLALAPTMNVFMDSLAIDTPSLPNGTLTIGYDVHLASSGGDGHYLYSYVSGRVPEGLALLADGTLGGRPTRSGHYTFVVRVESRGLSAEKSFVMDVVATNAPLEILTHETRNGALLAPYEQVLLAGGGEAPYTWFVDAGSVLPAGLDLTSEGTINGLPSQIGTFRFKVGVRDRLAGVDTVEMTIIITPSAAVIVLLSMPPPLVVGVPVDFQLQAAGGRGPYRWQAVSTPPPGLNVTESGHLVGTPSQVGRFKVRVQATGSGRNHTEDAAIIDVLVEDDGVFQVATKSLPSALVRERYEAVIEAVGGVPPYSWKLVPGTNLPDGFAFSTEGAPENAARVYGVGYRNVTQGFAVRVEDSMGRTREVGLALSIIRPDSADELSCTCLATSAPARSGWALVALGCFGLALALRRR